MPRVGSNRGSPGDADASAALADANRGLAELARIRASLEAAPTPEGWLDLSLRLFNEGDYMGSLAAAHEAARLRPDFAEAFNSVAAARSALGQWKEAAEAARRALSLKPDFPLARNNLQWALSQMSARTRAAAR